MTDRPSKGPTTPVPPSQPPAASRRPSQMLRSPSSSGPASGRPAQGSPGPSLPPSSAGPSSLRSTWAGASLPPASGGPTSRRSTQQLRRQVAGGDDAAQTEERRQRPGQVVNALFRLAKACQLYDDSNQTVQQAVAPLADAIKAYCAAFAADSVRLLFSPEMVFVNRRILRAPRESYALALQLGAQLAQAGVNEITLERDASPPGLLRLARLVADAQRSPQAAVELQTGSVAGITARSASMPDEWAAEQQESPVARVVKGYAASILILKGFHTRLARGDQRGGHEVKRIAQKLVSLGDAHPELLIATAASPLPDADPVRRAVSTAVIAQAMARQLTTDRVTLTTVVLAALLADVGSVRLGAETEHERLAPSALVVLGQLGKYYEASIRRTVVAYEALRADEPAADDPDGEAGGSRGLLAVLLRVARQFNELRSPRPGTSALGMDEAIGQLDAMASNPVEEAAVRLLVSGLGFFPQGTFVELTTGEVAMVAGTPRVALDFARPPVRLITDEQHRVLSQQLEVDLAKPAKGQPPRAIRKALVGGAVPTSIR